MENINETNHNVNQNFIHFHPKHLEDLKKSGLSDETILESGVYSVPPSDIDHILGHNLGTKVNSLLAFPYPGNRFRRYKLFSAVEDKDGHSIRYFQTKGSSSHLYLPDQIEAVIGDPSIPIFICEGEKKCLRAVQEGLPCIGLGGVWSWVSPGTYDLISFNRIALQGRRVNIVFDSPDIIANSSVRLAAVRLAKALLAKGAIPYLIILPVKKGDETKVGLDDFLTNHSVAEFLKLKRIPLTEEMIEKEIVSQLIHIGISKDVSTRKSPSSQCKMNTIKVFDLEGNSRKTTNFSAPCRAWDCPNCYPYLKGHWLKIILHNFPARKAFYSIVSDRKWGSWKKMVNGGSWFRVFSGTAGNYLVLSTAPINGSIPVSGQQFENLLKEYLEREPAPLTGRRKVTHSQNIELPQELKNPNLEEGSGKKKRIAVLIQMRLKEVIRRETEELGGKLISLGNHGETAILESPKTLLDRYRSMARGKFVPFNNLEDAFQMATVLGRV